MKGKSLYIYAIITIIYIVGIVGMSLPQTHSLFVGLSVTNILMANTLLLFYHKGFNANFIAKAVTIVVAGFLLEVVGVKTGVIFGHYSYSNVLGPKLFDVPLLIGLNWFFMVYCSVQIARLFKVSLLPTALLSGLFMVIYDFALEPNAIALHYWDWVGNTVPLQNYLAWFGFGSLFSFFFLYKNQLQANTMALFLYAIQVVFFISLIILR